MKVIVFAHRLEIGGTQISAIDLVTRLRDDHGFEPILFATPGPALELAIERGIRFEAAPDARFHPSMSRISALRALVKSEGVELVHAWDWWQCLEAYYGVHLTLGLPMIVTDMMMELTRILPRSIPTTFGTPEVLDTARERGYRRANLLVPPVDMDANSPGLASTAAFRERLRIAPDEIAIVTVSRLSHHLKGESLARTVSAIGQLGDDVAVKFVMVGGGEARGKLEAEASKVNELLGREAVVFAGELSDPREAYDAADIIVGMGSSAMRGAAFGKPVVVVGENGFSNVLEPATGDWFYYHGMYGIGDGDPDNSELTSNLRRLVSDKDLRESCGSFGHRFVTEHFSLEHVSGLLAGYYRDAVGDQTDARDFMDILRTTAIYFRERRFLTPSRDRRIEPMNYVAETQCRGDGHA